MNDKSPISASAPYCFALSVCVVFACAILCLVGVYLEWENWAYGYLMLPAFIILYALVVNFFVFRIGVLRHRKQYEKALGLIHKLSKWASIGKKNSYLHAMAASVYFMTENDEAMTQELALVVDKRWQFDRYGYLTFYHIFRKEEALAREQLALLSALSAKGEDALRTKQQLELLLKIIDPAEQERRSENIRACLAITNNDRIKKFLLEQETKG